MTLWRITCTTLKGKPYPMNIDELQGILDDADSGVLFSVEEVPE